MTDVSRCFSGTSRICNDIKRNVNNCLKCLHYVRGNYVFFVSNLLPLFRIDPGYTGLIGGKCRKISVFEFHEFYTSRM